MTNFDLVLKLLLQLTVILGACRLVTAIGRRYLSQTEVVCEMIAGVMLGPSLFGLIAPAAQQWLFPKAPILLAMGAKIPHPSMSILFALSQIGLIIYMFLVGLEFDGEAIKDRMKSAGMISGAGILAPFCLGALAALFLFNHGDLFKPGITPAAAALYLGASMSITAFPMLARMLCDRGIAQTRFGTLALAAGSMDDAAAWCLLAIVLASIKANINIAIFAIGGGLGYVLLMIFVGRRALTIFTRLTRPAGVTPQILVLALILLLLCSWFTDAIGIYAVFGAFILGTVMPRGEFAKQIHQRTEFLTTAFLLPIFFVFSGLNTQIGLVNTPALWAITALITAIAIIGKGVACLLAAKLAGESWRDAATIGVLMNARGLMELIILNIGLEQGVISPTLFTIMVIMAVVTTLLASPLVNLLLQGKDYTRENYSVHNN